MLNIMVFSKLKVGLMVLRKKIFRLLSFLIRKAIGCPKQQVEECVQYYLEHGDNKRALLIANIFIVLRKISRFDFSLPARQNVFQLARLYDFSRQTNSIIYEVLPEHFYLKKPVLLGDVTSEPSEGYTVTPRPYIASIHSAIITGGSNLVISEKTGELLNDEMVDFSTKDFGIKSPHVSYRYNNKVILGYKNKPNTHINEGILISCDHDNNYFHWLVECLPKLVFIDELNEFYNVPVLIPARLHKNLLAALTLVNIHNHPIKILEEGVAYHVDKLLFPSPLSRVIDRYVGHPAFDADIIFSNKWILKVANLIKHSDNQHKNRQSRKLYLARKKGLRALGNKDEIEQILSEYKFEIIDLSKLSLDYQIQLFSQASLIVAPTGAALTNMLFSRPGTKVIIFMSNHETTNHYFWTYLGEIAGLDVTTIIGKRLFNMTDYYSVHDDYIVDANIVREEIENFEQQ